MKLLLLGASGNLGAQVLEQGLQRGHQITALLREPARLGLEHAQLEIIRGDARNSADLSAAVAGQDAVVNCVGGEGDIRPEVLKGLIAAMTEAGVTRLINLGGAGILKLGPWLLYKLPVFPRDLVPVTEEHLKVYALLLDNSLDWTLVCPPFMAPGPGSGGYRVKADRPFLSAAKEIPLADVAGFILDELVYPRFIHQRVGIRRQ